MNFILIVGPWAAGVRRQFGAFSMPESCGPLVCGFLYLKQNREDKTMNFEEFKEKLTEDLKQALYEQTGEE